MGQHHSGMAAEEFKIVVVGAGGVGKSGLTLQFCAGKCPKRYDPTIEDSYRKTAEVNSKACTFDILDTAGQEEYASLRGEYMTEGKGFVLVYGITAEETFDQMDTWEEQIEQNKGSGDKVPIVLVGNKVDLESERKVSLEAGQALAEKWRNNKSDKIGDIMFKETSAMMNTNVGETFVDLAKAMMKGMPMSSVSANSQASAPVVADEPKTSGDKGGGCTCVVQ